MTKHNLKSLIPYEQFVWLFNFLFTEREIFQILMNTGIVSETDSVNSSTKQDLLNRFTDAFFDQAQIEINIFEHLSNKAEAAISRVGYMLVDEIKTFFKSPTSLIESGEFGNVVWALLNDAREDVHAHGFHLMSTAYEAYHDPLEENSQIQIADSPVQHTQTSEVQDIQENYTNQFNETTKEIEQQHKEINRLEVSIDELKAHQSAIQKKNKRLEQHCKFLIEENDRFKRRIYTFQEKEEKLIILQRDNDTLQQKATQFDDATANLQKVEAEHQQLLAKYEEISSQLTELNQFKTSTDSFMVELKLVEEAMFKENQALEQLKLDMQTQFDQLGKSHEVSREALNKIRMTVKHLEVPQSELITDTEKNTTDERVGVFVDVQNMFYAAKDRFERRVDYIKLLDLIVGPRELVCAYAYIVQIPEIKQGNFISLLEHNGYTIRSKDLRLRGDGSAKGDWDVGIAVDVVSMLGTLDAVILASGDGDFCPLAELIKQQQKRIEVVAFEHNTSMDLQAMADQFFPIGEELLM